MEVEGTVVQVAGVGAEAVVQVAGVGAEAVVRVEGAAVMSTYVSLTLNISVVL